MTVISILHIQTAQMVNTDSNNTILFGRLQPTLVLTFEFQIISSKLVRDVKESFLVVQVTFKEIMISVLIVISTTTWRI